MSGRIAAALLSLVLQSAAQFDPTGLWEGPCLSKEKSMGTLRVEFKREGRAWRAKGGLRTPGYPDDDSYFEEVAVNGARVSFVGLWGPMTAEFSGEHAAGTIKGELAVVQDKKTVMSCGWSLKRLPARK